MSFEVLISRSPELSARGIELATRALSAGDRVSAEHAYRTAMHGGLVHPASWSNLAALGIALEDAEGARAHAKRALALDQAHADAWNNFGVASWRLGQRRDAAKALHQALVLAPGLHAAALNYSLMLRSVNQLVQARAVLDSAASHAPRDWRLQQALAEITRLQGDATAMRKHVLAAIAQFPLVPTSELLITPDKSPDAASGNQVEAALVAAADALDAASVPFHLVGGTLLGIHRDGKPFPHDKDIDLGIPFECDRDVILAALADGFAPMRPLDGEAALASRPWVMGFTHAATGIGVDLFFIQRRESCMHNKVGWPDHLASEVPVYDLQTLRWRDRDWQIPSPPEVYLEGMYGPSWRTPMRFFDTQLSSPSCTAEALPRAINLALLRLLQALQQRKWEQALALCVQLSAREQLAEVEKVAAKLRKDATT